MKNYSAVIRVAIKTDGEETSFAEATLLPVHDLAFDGRKIADAVTALFYQAGAEMKK